MVTECQTLLEAVKTIHKNVEVRFVGTKDGWQVCVCVGNVILFETPEGSYDFVVNDAFHTVKKMSQRMLEVVKVDGGDSGG